MPTSADLAYESDPTVTPKFSLRGVRWFLVSLLAVLAILLFFPWASNSEPSVDVRSELTWSGGLAVLLGALALTFPHRWTSFVAFLPTIGALTDVGAVFLPESGSYSWFVKVVVALLSAIGITWIVSAFRYPAREQQTRWIIAPVAAVLTVATLWLPWVVVSEIGEQSGQMAAFNFFFASAATGAPGVGFTRFAIVIIMIVGLVGAILPLTSRKTTATRVAMHVTTGAAVAIVLLCLWLSLHSDAVRPADFATGPRVALAGFTLITLVWNSRLKAVEKDTQALGYASRPDDSGYIPVIMTGRAAPRRPRTPTPEFVAPEPNASRSSNDKLRTITGP